MENVSISGLSSTPLTNSITNTIDARMIVVPRLGCSMSSAAKAPNTTSTGCRVTRQLSTLSNRRASRSATNSSTASLANSDGWMRAKP